MGETEVASGAADATKIVLALGAGAAVSVGIGVYGSVHEGEAWQYTAFFSNMGAFKAWMTTAMLAFVLIQAGTAMRIYGKLSWPANVPSWLGDLHRMSGTLALLFSLPVAFHCLYVLGFNGGAENTRTLVHSLAGCFVYGAFVVKVTGVRLHGLPGWVLPTLGGSTFVGFTVVWLTSSLWFFTSSPLAVF